MARGSRTGSPAHRPAGQTRRPAPTPVPSGGFWGETGEDTTPKLTWSPLQSHVCTCHMGFSTRGTWPPGDAGSARRQVRWSRRGRCARRGPWRQRPGQGSATDRGGRGGLWPVRGTGRGQSRSGRVGTEPPHCAPRAQPWTPARASGRGSQGGVRGGCPGSAEDTGRQGRQPRPALAAASGRWDSCVLLAMLDAEGPCGGARQAACDTGAPQGAAGAAGAQDTHRSGAPRHCRDVAVTGAMRVQRAALWPGPARGQSRRHGPAFPGAALLRPGSPSARQRPHPRAPFSLCSFVKVRCVSAFLCFGVTWYDHGGPLKPLLCLTCWPCVGGASSLAARLTTLTAVGSGCHCPLAGLPASDGLRVCPGRPRTFCSLWRKTFLFTFESPRAFSLKPTSCR